MNIPQRITVSHANQQVVFFPTISHSFCQDAAHPPGAKEGF